MQNECDDRTRNYMLNYPKNCIYFFVGHLAFYLMFELYSFDVLKHLIVNDELQSTPRNMHMAERQLASIRQIHTLVPIEGADLIELALVDGWQCITKKGEFQEGDLGVYYEIDSFLPATDERYTFLDPKFIDWEGKRGARLRTMKMRKQLSQGLVLPLSLFPEIENPEEGLDVTELLGIEKWERPVNPQIQGMPKGNFPPQIPKTNETRIQNLHPSIINKFLDEQFEVTVKMDGSSMTVYLIDGAFGTCSHNVDLKEDEYNLFWQNARKYDLETALRDYSDRTGHELAVQGELVSTNIQSNYEKIPGNIGSQFRVFKIYNITTGEYLNPDDRWAFVSTYNLEHVPLATIKGVAPTAGVYPTLRSFGATRDELLDNADGPSVI
jgi:RNA ligase (TIGR02306 family)